MMAITHMYIPVITFLFEHGADVTIQNTTSGEDVFKMLGLGHTRSHAKVSELCRQYIDLRPLLK